MELYDYFTQSLRRELIPALGCTEPIAIAYTSAIARDILGEQPKKATLKVSGNVLKNVKSVSVPNTEGMKGVDSACVVGIIGGEQSLGLEVLQNVKPEHIAKAKDLLSQGYCTVEHLKSNEPLHIIVTAFGEKNCAEAELKGGHTRIVRKSFNNEDIFVLDEKTEDELKVNCELRDIFDFACNTPIEPVKDIIERQIKYNLAICQEGMRNSYGQNIGKTLMKIYGDDAKTTARALAAAGSDARMSGCSLPVVINSGSGNQGITVSIPVIVFAEKLKVSEEKLYRALILSNLVAIHLKKGMGKLSAFCGVVSASCGAGAGITYLHTEDFDLVSQTITNTVANVSGIMCDGAKGSCAAKIASSIDACILGHYLTMSQNTFKSGDGIVREDIDKTLDGVMKIGKDAMKETDEEILNIMFSAYK